MKKALSAIAALLLVCSLTSCNNFGFPVEDLTPDINDKNHTEKPTDDQNSPNTSNDPDDPIKIPNPVNPPANLVYPEVTITEASAYMFVGDTHKIQYKTKTGDQTNTNIINWMSSSKCVSVQNGVITANKEGFAYVSANGGNQMLVSVLPRKMATMSVNTGGADITSNEVYTTCSVSLDTENEDYNLSSVPAGIRLRGNSTKLNPKKPYRIKFNSKQNLLGMNSGAEYKSWVLLAEYQHDSLSQNTAAFTAAALILEEYSSDWRYVTLKINGVNMGVYVLCEQSQINEHRVDIEHGGEKSKELMTGYLMEFDASLGMADNKFRLYYDNLEIMKIDGEKYTRACNDEGKQLCYVALKNNEYTNDQFLFMKYYVRSVFRIIYEATYFNKAYVFADDFIEDPSKADEYLARCRVDNGIKLLETTSLTPKEAIERVVDVESLARMYIFSEIVCNGDDSKKSYYFWVDLSENGSKKLTFGCPWDHDGAMVAWNTHTFRDTEGYYTAIRNLWYVMIINNEWFVDKVKELWQDIYSCSNAFENVTDVVLLSSDVYKEEFLTDNVLWQRKHSQSDQAILLAEWLTDRIEWMNSVFGSTEQIS